MRLRNAMNGVVGARVGAWVGVWVSEWSIFEEESHLYSVRVLRVILTTVLLVFSNTALTKC